MQRGQSDSRFLLIRTYIHVQISRMYLHTHMLPTNIQIYGCTVHPRAFQIITIPRLFIFNWKNAFFLRHKRIFCVCLRYVWIRDTVIEILRLRFLPSGKRMSEKAEIYLHWICHTERETQNWAEREGNYHHFDDDETDSRGFLSMTQLQQRRDGDGSG